MTLLENLQNDVSVFLTAQSAAAPLLKRVFLFLEDGEFIQADAYCEKVLDIEPENALAYLCKLMASRRMQSLPDLLNTQYTIDSDGSFKKAMRFASADLKQHLQALNMLIYGNCIAACRSRAKVHLEHGEMKETAQQYHEATKLWEDSKETLPNAQAIYNDLANEVADFNWQLLLHSRQCPDNNQLISRGIPVDNDRWYLSAVKWADEAKREQFEAVAAETLFQAHLKCTNAIKSGQTKLAEIWASHYKASAPQGDPMVDIHDALVKTDGYTQFSANAPVSLLELIAHYTQHYPQGVENTKAILQEYYQTIFQSALDFSAGDFTQAMDSARDITRHMYDAVSEGFSPYGQVSTYLVAAKALTLRYSKQDGVVTQPQLFRFICQYYKDAVDCAQPDQAKAISAKFNDFLLETIRLDSATADIVSDASGYMGGSNAPYQIFLSRLTNNYCVEKEVLIPQQLTAELSAQHRLIMETHPKKDCYWFKDQETFFTEFFATVNEAVDTCRAYPQMLQDKLSDPYTAVIHYAGDSQEEISSGWTAKMQALQDLCDQWADQLQQDLALVQEDYAAKLVIAEKQIKVKKAFQLTASIVSGVIILAFALVFAVPLIISAGLGWSAVQAPPALTQTDTIWYYGLHIGLPTIAAVLSLVNALSLRPKHAERFQRLMGLFLFFEILISVAMGILAGEALPDLGFSAIEYQKSSHYVIAASIPALTAIGKILLTYAMSKLKERTRSNAAKAVCGADHTATAIIALAQTIICFAVTALFIYSLIIH